MCRTGLVYRQCDCGADITCATIWECWDCYLAATADDE